MVTIKDRSELDADVAAFLARGNRVTPVPAEMSGIDPLIRNCKCGCKGDWYDHSMRAGESGRQVRAVVS